MIFELYNEDGSLQLNLSSRITTVLGTLYITEAGAMNVPALSRGQLFYVFNPAPGPTPYVGLYPQVTQDGTTLRWTKPGNGCYMTYGTF